MFINILICLGLLAIAGLFVWLARRALRLRNPFARWSLAVVAALPALLLILITGLISYGYYSLYRPRSAPAIQLDTSASPARLARGEHLARSTCVACHTTGGELPLSGGIDLSVDSPLPIGSLTPPNLTPGGPLKDWSDEEIVQAIRNGLHQNGRVLLMPTEVLRNLSDEDIASLVVFLRSQPTVANETQPIYVSPVLAMFVGAGLAPVGEKPVVEPVVAPAKAPTVEYGGYILSYQDCQSCHGPDLNGSPGGLGPAAPSVRAFLKNWTAEQFIQTMRTGVDPGGHLIQPPMPWKMIGQMDDDELTALYLYIRNMHE